jgi:hypothetical protein
MSSLHVLSPTRVYKHHLNLGLKAADVEGGGRAATLKNKKTCRKTSPLKNARKIDGVGRRGAIQRVDLTVKPS